MIPWHLFVAAIFDTKAFAKLRAPDAVAHVSARALERAAVRGLLHNRGLDRGLVTYYTVLSSNFTRVASTYSGQRRIRMNCSSSKRGAT
jgi:hypothetical protein